MDILIQFSDIEQVNIQIGPSNKDKTKANSKDLNII